MIRETLQNCFKTSTMYAALILFSATIALSACSGGGGGGGGAGLPDTDDDILFFGEDTDPDSIFPGPGESPIKVLRTGEGVVSAFINSPGDVDYYQLQLRANVRYGLQAFHFPTVFGNQPINSEHRFTLFNSTGTTTDGTPVTWTGDDAWPGVIAPVLTESSLVGVGAGGATALLGGNLAFSWVAPYTGKYYIRVENFFSAGIGEYSFRLMSSQLGVATAREASVSNFRSFTTLVDPEDGWLVYNGQASGTISPIEFHIGPTFDGGSTSRVSFGWSVSQPIYFLTDEDGTVSDTPETPAVHIHYGIPSRHLADGQDDIFYNNDPVSPIWPFLGPNDNYLPDNNLTPDPGVVVDIGIGSIADVLLTPDMVHLMLGQHWYVDVHYHSNSNTELDSTTDITLASTPIVSSRPQGGLSMYDSRLVLNGFDFPEGTDTGATETLEVFYSDEHQAFYLQYGLNSSLAGQDIHVHAGGPESTGPIIVDLGTVPFPTIRPVYEPEWDVGPLGPGLTFRFIPNLENIIKKITNIEAQALKDATFNGGWYIDVHTDPFFSDPDHPLIRSDAILFDNLEVAALYAPDFLVRSDENFEAQLARASFKDTGDSGDVNFVSDDLAYGPIVVYLDNETMGQLDLAAGDDAIACGQDVPGQSIGIVGKSGTYAYHGSAANGVYWEGTVTIEAGACITVVLASEDAIVEE